MEKINIAEILKNCPKGMELDCTICDNVCLYEVTPHTIKCYIKNDVYNTIYFHHDGTYLTAQNAKCVIFPKGKTTWEGFQRPFKDGDIVATLKGNQIFIFKENIENVDNSFSGVCYFGVDLNDEEMFKEGRWHFTRLATEEEKDKLFKAINDNGYKWNDKTKTLEKLIVPKFKVGDKIEKCTYSFTIIEVKEDYYLTKGGNKIPIEYQDDFNLIPNKFDIHTLKPFQEVLVRNTNGQV